MRRKLIAIKCREKDLLVDRKQSIRERHHDHRGLENDCEKQNTVENDGQKAKTTQGRRANVDDLFFQYEALIIKKC